MMKYMSRATRNILLSHKCARNFSLCLLLTIFRELKPEWLFFHLFTVCLTFRRANKRKRQDEERNRRLTEGGGPYAGAGGKGTYGNGYGQGRGGYGNSLGGGLGDRRSPDALSAKSGLDFSGR